MFENVKQFIKNAIEIAGIYILWISIHFICSNMYPHFCAEFTAIGFIKSMFVIEAPHCEAMRWVIYNGGNIIHGMWAAIGIWFTKQLLVHNK